MYSSLPEPRVTIFKNPELLLPVTLHPAAVIFVPIVAAETVPPASVTEQSSLEPFKV